MPIEKSPAITYPTLTLTSIVGGRVGINVVSGFNVLLVGTHDGSVRKILLSSLQVAEEFDQIVIDQGHPILADMFLDHSRRYLFVASPYKVAKLLVEHCPTGSYSTCRACLSSRNPYCGWCSLQKTCTLRSKCDITTTIINAGTSTVSRLGAQSGNGGGGGGGSRWLSVDSNRCVEFQSIYPEFLPLNSLDKVKLVINQLPRLPRNITYQCVFAATSSGSGASGTTTNNNKNHLELPPTIEAAEPMANGLVCQTPPLAQRPPLPRGQDFVTVELSIRPSDSGTDFLNRKFIFYDCNFYRT